MIGRSILLLSSLLLVAACSETNISGGSDFDEPPNPPDLTVEPTIDRTVQVTIPAVDVLWVIDDSCSMGEEQDALAANFDAFINYFVVSDLDYHVGVVSTGWDEDSARGRLREAQGVRWIDSDTRNPVDVFAGMALLGTDGPAEEKGRNQVYGAIELLGAEGRPNHGFYREDASLAVVVISDEDDASGDTVISRSGFVDWLQGLKPDPSMVTFSSIVSDDPNCGDGVSEDYLWVTRRVGGIEWPICDGRWQVVLEQLGIQASGLRSEYFLSQVPVEDTIRVWVEDDVGRIDFERQVDWTYDRARNSITFLDFVPEPLSEVYISYIPLAAVQTGDSPTD